jgi:hypothetical protein
MTNAPCSTAAVTTEDEDDDEDDDEDEDDGWRRGLAVPRYPVLRSYRRKSSARTRTCLLGLRQEGRQASTMGCRRQAAPQGRKDLAGGVSPRNA